MAAVFFIGTIAVYPAVECIDWESRGQGTKVFTYKRLKLHFFICISFCFIAAAALRHFHSTFDECDVILLIFSQVTQHYLRSVDGSNIKCLKETNICWVTIANIELLKNLSYSVGQKPISISFSFLLRRKWKHLQINVVKNIPSKNKIQNHIFLVFSALRLSSNFFIHSLNWMLSSVAFVDPVQ